MNILHLVNDDKFLAFARGMFDALPGVNNRFVARVASPETQLRHIGRMALWRLAGRRYFFSGDMAKDLAWCDCLVVHYAEGLAAIMMLRTPPRVTLVWSGWGADYYPLMQTGEQALLADDTRKLVSGMRAGWGCRAIAATAKRLLDAAKWRVLERPLLLAASGRADFFSAPIPDDFHLLRNALGDRFRARYLQLSYGTVEETFKPGPESVTGRNILLGNSATPSNNHAEILKLLATHDLGDRRVVVPLSYGDPVYRDAIVSLGKELLGERFQPVLEFLPLPDYNALIARCSAAIMNHRRQQGLGNAGAMLYKGARVFFDENSVAYRFFKSRGAYVESTSLLAEPAPSLFEPLPEDQRLRNRAILEGLWGHDVVMENARTFLRTIEACKSRKTTPHA